MKVNIQKSVKLFVNPKNTQFYLDGGENTRNSNENANLSVHVVNVETRRYIA